MKKINKTIKIHIGILLLFYMLLILCITKFQYIFGSNVDFIRQHAVLPDYFRNLFYKTGKMFPEFALHLGGGQNIFYFAYYGFLSPITLFSYLFPFLDTTIYLMLSSIVLVFISAILLYYFLRKNQMNYNICFISSLLFLFSNSYIFHSHRHLMFVNYMPFLLLALLGVIKYFEKNKSSLLIISIFLMIITSFYFSIPGLLVICFYGLYYYLKQNKQIKIKEILLASLKFLFRIFLGIFLSCFFLLPIIYIILNGRSTSEPSLNLSLFLPSINLEYLMYGTYGVGLTSILWITLIYNILFSKKEYRTLAILTFFITLFPIINTILNGGLYTNGKCFIPFIPIYILFIANTIKNIETQKIKWPFLLLGLVLSFLFLKTKWTYFCLFFLELFITLICFYFFQKKKKYYFFLPIIILAFGICIATNQTDNLITFDEYKNLKDTKTLDYEKYMENMSLYRFIDNQNSSNNINYSKANKDYRITSYSSTTNPYYTNTFYNSFNNNDIYRNEFMLNETNNLFFHRFMGIKYLLTNKDVPFGYHEIKSYDKSTLYSTNNVYPLGFASNHILNKQEYNSLSFNEQLEAFNNNIIIDGKSKNANLIIQSEKIQLDYEVLNKKNISYEIDEDHYKITSKKNGKIVLKLKEEIQDKSLIIRFIMNNIPNCKNGDVAITINNIMNKLTCGSWKYYNNNETFDYVLSSNQPIDTLEILFTKGTYDISELEIYQIPNTYFLINEEDISPLIINDTYKKDSILNGEIQVKEDGYFLFSIPYDKGFEVIIDDQVQDYELVNDAFIGFPIEKGTHNVTLKFHAPLLKIGKFISLLSLLAMSALLFIEKNKNT